MDTRDGCFDESFLDESESMPPELFHPSRAARTAGDVEAKKDREATNQNSC
jgi:hypothetical protein